MERIAPFESHGFNSSNGTSLQSSRLKDNFLGFPSTSKTAPLKSSLSQNGSLDESIPNDSVRYASVIRKGNKMIMVEKSIHTTSAGIEGTDIEAKLTNELPQNQREQKNQPNKIDHLSETMRKQNLEKGIGKWSHSIDRINMRFYDEKLESEYMSRLVASNSKSVLIILSVISAFCALYIFFLMLIKSYIISTIIGTQLLLLIGIAMYFRSVKSLISYKVAWHAVFISSMLTTVLSYYMLQVPYIADFFFHLILMFASCLRYRCIRYFQIVMAGSVIWAVIMLQFASEVEFIQLLAYNMMVSSSTSIYTFVVEYVERRTKKTNLLKQLIHREKEQTESLFFLLFPRSVSNAISSCQQNRTILRNKENVTYAHVRISKSIHSKTPKTVQDLVDLFCSFGFEVVKEQAEGLLLCEPLNEGNASIPFDSLLHNLVSYVRTKDFATEFTFNTDQPEVTILIGRGCVVGGVLGTKMKSYDLFGQGIKNIMSVADGELNPGVWVQSDLYHQHFQTPNIEKAADVIVCNQGYEWIWVGKFLEIVKEGTEVAHEGTIHAPLHEDDEGGETNKDFDATQNQQPNKISLRAAKKNLMITGWGLLELGITESMRERNKWIGIYYLVRYGVVGVIALSGVLVSVLILAESITDGSIISQISYIRVIIPYLYMPVVMTKGFLFVTDGGLASKSDPELFFTLSEGLISACVLFIIPSQKKSILLFELHSWILPWTAIYYYYPGKIFDGSTYSRMTYFSINAGILLGCGAVFRLQHNKRISFFRKARKELLQESLVAEKTKLMLDDAILSAVPNLEYRYFQSSERFEMRHAQHLIVIYSTFSWLHDFNESTQHESHWHFIQEFHHYVELISSYFQVPLMRSIGDRLIFAQITESAEKWPDEIVRCIQFCVQLKSFYDQCMKDGTKSLKSYRICVASGTGLYGFKGSYQISYDVSGQAYTECCHQMKMPKVECIEVSRHIYDVVNQKHLFLTRKEGYDDSSRFFVLGSRDEWARYVSHEFKEHLDNHE